MGTSLTVHPFASLAGMVEESCPRVLINLDLVGDFGSRGDDVILLGKCDEIVTELCKELGWEQELLQLWEKTGASVLDDGPKETVPPETTSKRQEPDQLKDVTAKMAQLVVDAAEREGDSGTFASKPSLSQAEIPENLKKEAPTEKVPSSSDLQNTTVDATSTKEQKPSSKEDEATPLADGNSKL